MTGTGTAGRTGPVYGGRAGSAPSLGRLVAVELRKAVDTRAGRWLLVAVAALTVAAVAAQAAFGTADGRTLGSLAASAQLPISVLLPVVGLLSVTGEWSQRTGLSTFSLVPDRLRVFAAKALAATAVALAGAAFALASAAAGFALGPTTGRWDLPAAVVAQLVLVDWVTMLCGFAFGLLILSSAPAIAVYYALPIAWSAAGRLVPGLHGTASWLDVGQAREPMVDAGVTAGEWARFLTSALLWVALPAALGAWRARRAEIG